MSFDKDLEAKNMFGGANPNGMYVPMTDIEQEVLERIAETQDLEIEIHGWGHVRNPLMTFGDHRIGLVFTLNFNKPAIPMPVHFFDMSLRIASSKLLLSNKRHALPPMPDGQPMMIGAGLSLTFQWDIALDHMSPELVKAIKPGAIGLTTRRLDPVTGNRTLQGNMNLSEDQARVAKALDAQNAAFARSDALKAVQATKAAGYDVKETADGVVLPDPI